MDYNMFSENMKNIQISGIRRFYNKAAGVKDAVSLTLGQPDFEVPSKVKDAMINAINSNKTTYTSNSGIVELREEISKYLTLSDIDYTSEEICITVGGSEALMDVFITFLNKGDKVLIPDPGYPAYESCVKLMGGKVINYGLNEDFSIDVDKIQELIKKENPKMLVLSMPSNPTGAVLSKEDRDKLYNLIKSEDILVISDEMYSALCFEKEYYSLCQHKDIKDKVILIGGFSKMFSMTGLRIGYLCAEEYLMKEIMKVHQYNVSCAASIAQYGALEGLRSCLEDVEYMKSKFIERRDYLYKELNRIGLECVLPKGAFYIFPSIKKFGINSEEFCEKLLREGKVAVIPGSAFGEKGEGYVRMSYAYSMEQLKECIYRMEKFISLL